MPSLACWVHLVVYNKETSSSKKFPFRSRYFRSFFDDSEGAVECEKPTTEKLSSVHKKFVFSRGVNDGMCHETHSTLWLRGPVETRFRFVRSGSPVDWLITGEQAAQPEKAAFRV